ncbi:hypothetical protein CDAR_514951 [Caerostris darwini]|uniref:Uncharacterized protein n=1 Tax=Caerostris darwini TaxID=1538125 RepID=A0AAV4WXE1_9ARAC|nr:hypothetical protein CDAR_514951 [Caerostris darwini]
MPIIFIYYTHFQNISRDKFLTRKNTSFLTTSNNARYSTIPFLHPAFSKKPEENVFFSVQNDLAVDKKMSSPVGRWSFPKMRSRITTRGIFLDKQHYPCSRLDASDDGSCRDHDAVSSTSALLSSSVFAMSPSLVEWVSWLIA